MVDEEKTLREKIDFIFSEYSEKESKKNKKFKLPLKITMGKGKLKKNYILILFLQTNGNCIFKFEKIEDNTVKINDIYYDASADYIMRYKKFPLLIIPEWNIKPIRQPDGRIVNAPAPFESKENMEEATKKGSLSATEKVILTAIKLDLIKPKMKFNIGMILLVLALLGGGYYLLDYLKII